jgi:hypothetical protein
MEYQVISRRTISDLANAVRDALQAGWKPQGGVAIAVWAGEGFLKTPTEYAQAVVRSGRRSE